MDPNKIQLELANDFYDKIKAKKRLNRSNIQDLTKYIRELQYIAAKNLCKGRGQKVVTYLLKKLQVILRKQMVLADYEDKKITNEQQPVRT